MVKRHDKGHDGKYHINGKKYDLLEGSRAQVWHGTAYKTPGGLTKVHLKMNRGRIVSVKKSNLARSQNTLRDIFNQREVEYLVPLLKKERRREPKRERDLEDDKLFK